MRVSVTLFLSLILAGATACGADGGDGDDPNSLRVSTESGPVLGRSSDGVARFRGIPYAAPPTGPRRFAAPEPPQPWSAPRQAFASGPPCPQLNEGVYRGDEDCLTLDVWAPADVPGSDARLPVMVWIHGGALVIGAAGDPTYDASELVRAGDVVVVSPHYRLGALGFLATAALRDASGDGSVGNYGLRDQLRALTWVRDNIEQFGGDPERVTVFGNSAGGGSINALAAVPAADSLFHAAIVQSAPSAENLPEPENAAQGPSSFERSAPLVAAVDCTRSAGADELACLRQVPARRLVEALGELDQDDLIAPGFGEVGHTVDGVLLPEQPLDAMISDSAPHRRWIIGSTREEAGVLGLYPLALALLVPGVYESTVADLFGELSAALLAVYPVEDYPSPFDALVALLSESYVTCPGRRQAQALSARGDEVYEYRFVHHLDGDRGALGSFHSIEVPLLFGTQGDALGGLYEDYQPSEADRAAGALLRAAWSVFAHGAVPDPSWPRARADALVDIDSAIAVSENPTEGRCQALAAPL